MKKLISFSDEEMIKEYEKILKELGYESFSARIEELVASDLALLYLMLKIKKGEKA